MSRYDRNLAALLLERRARHKAADADAAARTIEAYLQFQPWNWQYHEASDNWEYGRNLLRALRGSGVRIEGRFTTLVAPIRDLAHFVQLVTACRRYLGDGVDYWGVAPYGWSWRDQEVDPVAYHELQQMLETMITPPEGEEPEEEE